MRSLGRTKRKQEVNINSVLKIMAYKCGLGHVKFPWSSLVNIIMYLRILFKEEDFPTS